MMAATVLLTGAAALLVSPPSGSEAVSWESLLAPYSQGTPLPGGFRIAEIRRGSANDVVVLVRRREDPDAAVEVHVLPRGRWPGVRESQSFSVGYETPRSPAREREEVTELLAETIRSRDRGLPSPDAIPLGPSFDPSTLPPQLDRLRGWRGVLAGASLFMLGWIAAVQSAGLVLAGVGLGAIDLLARTASVPHGQPDIAGAWLVPGAALLFVVAFRRRAVVSRRELLLALAILAIALSLRLALGPWGPLHTNGYAPLFITGAARDPTALASYGPGYVEMFGPIAAMAPENPDWAIFACNALLSALVPVLAFALGRLAGVTPRAAAAAALLLAIDPVAIRMAATESYFPAITLLCIGAGVGLLAATHERVAESQWRMALGFVAAGLLLVQAARIHPSAWGVVATVPFVVLAANVSATRRILALAAGAAITGGVLVAISGGVLVDVFANMRGGALMRPSPPSLGPLVWVAAGTAAYAILAPRKWLAVAAGLSVAGMLMTRHLYWQSWIWQQSYDRLYLTVPLIAAAAALPARLWHRPGVVAVLAVLVLFSWLRFGLPIVAARTTDHLEYRWLREQIAGFPPHCRVVNVVCAGKRCLMLPTYVESRSRAAVAIDPSRPHTIEEALSPAPCLYYVRTSLCSSDEGRPACEEVESRLEMMPVARASFPARPSSGLIPYDRDPVETLIARVERVRGAAPP
jgi:hypothetical protein